MSNEHDEHDEHEHEHDDERQLWRADDVALAELAETPGAEQTSDATSDEPAPARSCDAPGGPREAP